MRQIQRNDNSYDYWVSFLKTELSSNRPVFYAVPIHAWVCYGYDSNDYFAMNWGWGGHSDGYYQLQALKPLDMNLTDNHYMVIGIMPEKNLSLSVSASALQFSASGEQHTLAIESNTEWSLNSNASWLTVTPSSGSKNGTVTVQASANPDKSPRTAIISVNATGGPTRIIRVAQAGSETSIEVSSWNLTPTMKATLTLEGTLTVTTTQTGEKMPDYNVGSPPWYDERNSIVTAVIGNNVTSIGNTAFHSHYNLHSVKIPNSVTSIGDFVFFRCDLVSVNIPKSVTSIGASAFSTCRRLSSVSVDEENPYYSSKDGVLYSKDKTVLYYYPINKMGQSFTIPDSVKTIESSVFNINFHLSEIIIPASVTKIGERAFSSSMLNSVTIPNSVTVIEPQTFENCQNLASVKIPASITAIGRQAFNYCRALKDVTVEWTTPLLIFSSYEIFLNCPVNEATLHVPTGTKALYERAEVWKDFGTIVEYSPVGNEEKVPEVQPALQAYAANGILYVSGLQYGKPLYIYNIQGQLVYKGVAKAETEQIPLSINEYYIVVSAGQAIKTILK